MDKPQAGPRPWVVLFVDDEADIAGAMQGLLEASLPGVRVLTALGGREGLELLDQERVDLVISDFKMPGMDGIEFLYQCRRLHPNIPRIMFTAYQSEDLARRAVAEAVVSVFLSKTTEPEELVRGVAKLLSYVPGAASHGEAGATEAPA